MRQIKSRIFMWNTFHFFLLHSNKWCCCCFHFQLELNELTRQVNEVENIHAVFCKYPQIMIFPQNRQIYQKKNIRSFFSPYNVTLFFAFRGKNSGKKMKEIKIGCHTKLVATKRKLTTTMWQQKISALDEKYVVFHTNVVFFWTKIMNKWMKHVYM